MAGKTQGENAGEGRLYGVFLSLAGKRVVVIGGGVVAQRKVEGLLTVGAAVEVISPEATEWLAERSRQGRLVWRQREYKPGDLGQAWLVVCACGRREVDTVVAQEAQGEGIWCNVVDEPELCTFQVPAVMRRGALQIAISTGGVGPALAGHLRRELEGRFGPAWEGYLAAMGELRAWAKERWPGDERRRGQVLKGFVEAKGWQLLEAGDEAGFAKLVEEWKEHCQ